VVTVSLNLPGPGEVTTAATANVPNKLLASAARKITVAKKKASVTAAGLTKVKLKANRRAMKVLRKRGRLRASLKVTFTPTGGTARSASRKVTFKLRR
jgi:hypothetical protein